ncbi:MAG: metallophosphoesterase [Bryobacteraceae bacterium]
MKLLIFSDIHGDLRALARLIEMEADYYVAAGDLVSFGRGLERCGKILQQRAGRVYVLPGNHESASQIADFCTEFGLSPFHEQSALWGAYHVAGLGYSSYTPFHTPGEYSEAQIAAKLAPFEALAPLILICHCPPHGTDLDRIRNGTHGGSTAILDFVKKHQPEYFFCGHIHEAEGMRQQIGGTLAVNVGKQGYLLEL